MSELPKNLKLNDVGFGFGEVQCFSKVDAVPATTKVKGNVTIKNEGSPEIPTHYEVTHRVRCKFGEGLEETLNYLNWTVRLYGIDKKSPYHAIEAEAARHIAPMLRAVAQEIEDRVAEYDAENKNS